jgi:hypothetical protein
MRRPSFVAHLLDEGVTLKALPEWEGLRDDLARTVSDPDLLLGEISSYIHSLAQLECSGIFSTSPITALSHLYTIARSLVFARLLQQGVHEYRWQAAFDIYGSLYPCSRQVTQNLKALRPYYEYARGRRRNCHLPSNLEPSGFLYLLRSTMQLADD